MKERASLPIILIGIALNLPLLGLIGANRWNHYQFNRLCGQHLKMAADAGDVTTAAARLGRAIDYLESHGLTAGTTAVLADDPAYRLDSWFANLKSEQVHLEMFSSAATESDRNNALMKLREVILDHGDEGDHVTLPHDIALYPSHAGYFWGYWIFGISGLAGVLMIASQVEA